MRQRANILIIAAAIIVLVIVGVFTSTQKTPPTPYDSQSSAPTGALALYRWLTTLGYRPQRLTDAPWRPDGVRALFVLEPGVNFTATEARSVREWTRRGGTLILLEDENSADTALIAGLGLIVQATPATLNPLASNGAPYGAAPLQPLLERPPLRGLDTTVTAAITGAAPGVVAVLGAGGLRAPSDRSHTAIAPPDPTRPVLLYQRLGRGRVYACSTPAVLTNGTIARGDNRRLVPNLLAGLPAGAAVGIDDYHLIPRTQAQEPATLGDALVMTPWGRALLYALALVALYIALTGRRLGRPLRAAPERGRSLAEYVVSMAAIFRRAGLRVRVLDLWQGDLRRALAGPGGVRGRDDAALVAEAARRAGLTPAESDEALVLLRPRAVLDESSLVELCRRIAHLQERVRKA